MPRNSFTPFAILPLEILAYELFAHMPVWDFVLWSLACKEHLRIVYLLGHEWLRVYFLKSCQIKVIQKTQMQPLSLAVACFAANPPLSYSGMADRFVTFTAGFARVLVCPWEPGSPEGCKGETWLDVPLRCFKKASQVFWIPINDKQNSLDCFRKVNFLPVMYLTREIYADYVFALAQASLTATDKVLACPTAGFPDSLGFPAFARVTNAGAVVYNFLSLQSLYRILQISPKYDFSRTIQPVYGNIDLGLRMMGFPIDHKTSPTWHNSTTLRPFNFAVYFSAPIALYNVTQGRHASDVIGDQVLKREGLQESTCAGSADVVFFEFDKLQEMHFKCVVNEASDKLVHALFPDVYGGHYCGSGQNPHMLETDTHAIISAVFAGMTDEETQPATGLGVEVD